MRGCPANQLDELVLRLRLDYCFRGCVTDQGLDEAWNGSDVMTLELAFRLAERYAASKSAL
jgi:hypothetical protein